MTRVAAYTRVSSQEQAEHGVSLGDQKQRLESLAKVESWEITGFYCDQGYSGGTDNRPELQRLMHDAKAGSFDIVAVTKIDRFFRNTRLLLDYIHQLESYGVSFSAQAEGIDTRKPGIGNIILALLGSVAEWERGRIGERVKDFRSHLASKGRWSSGRAPFGYRFNKTAKTLDVYEPEAEAIRYAFNTYANEQIGMMRLAERMNEKRFITPRMGRRQHTTWTISTTKHILEHPAYKGEVTTNWQFITPEIVTPELWLKVQSRIANNRHVKPTSNSPHWLRGKLKCGLCGHTLRLGYSHGTKPIYECPGRLKALHLDGSTRCTLPRMEASALEEKLAGQLLLLVSNPQLFRNHILNTVNNLEHEHEALLARLKPLGKEAEAIREEMSIIDTRLEMHRIDKDIYKERMTQLQHKLQEVERRQKQSDPLLVKELQTNEARLKAYRNAIKGNLTFAELKEKKQSLTRSQAIPSDGVALACAICSEGKVTEIIYPRDLIPQIYQDLVGFVYSDHAELKSMVSVGKCSSTPTCKNDISLPLSVSVEIK